jgi:hypothetical protein
MIRKWWIALALILCCVAVAGCNDDAPDIAAAKHDQELQSVQLQTEADAAIGGALIKGTQILVATSLATLIMIVGEAGIYGWRSMLFPVATAWQRDEQASNERVALAIAEAQRQLPPTTYNYGAAIDGEWRNVDEPLQLAAAPVAPSWQALQQAGFVASADHFLLGYSATGPVYISLPSCPSMIVAGRPRKGKTNFLRLCAAQILQMGGGVILFDAHGSVVGARPVARLAQASTNKGAAMDMLAMRLDQLLDERLDAYARGHRQFTPVMVVADELPRLAVMSEPAIAVIRRAIMEGPKVGIYSATGGQGVSAAMMGGSTARDSAGARICYAASQRQAYMVGFDADSADLVAALDTPGMCYAEGPIPTTLLATPLTVEDDLSGPLQLPAPAPIARYVPAEAVKQEAAELNGSDANLNGNFMALNGLNGYENDEFYRALETVKASKNMRQAVARWLDISEDKAVGDTYTKGSQALWAALKGNEVA